MSTTAFLSLGSNLGDKQANITCAIKLLCAHSDIEHVATSSFYRTAPVGFTDQDWFINIALAIETALDPESLLEHCQQVEHQLKRQRNLRWGPRTLDVDILLYGTEQFNSERLILPHPRMLERAFVLVPLQEIAPNLILLEQSIEHHIAQLSEQAIERIQPPHVETFSRIWTGSQLLSIFEQSPYRSLLESTEHNTRQGRYTIFCHSPHRVFEAKGQQVRVWEQGNWSEMTTDPLAYLDRLLEAHHQPMSQQFPFVGGAVGYFSYDLCHQFEKLSRKAVDDRNIPDIHFCFYDCAIIVDHQLEKTHVVVTISNDAGKLLFQQTVEQLKTDRTVFSEPLAAPSKTSAPLQSNMTAADYIAKVEQIKRYIESGDIYQVNLAQRFEHSIEDSPETLYQKLSKINPAPYAGFLELAAGAILSSSPERFLRLEGGSVQTRPIKGTRPRGATAAEDEQLKTALLTSEKERAELLMIVDLERNDLGRICQPGSVQVESLYEVETYPTVHHLVGEIHGILREGVTLSECLRAAFPGGSITGAPKIRAMEIIDELEPHQRTIFTGSMGYISYDGRMDFNIAIRTILCQDSKAYLQVGAGIVWDSEPEAEYQETLDKAKALFHALGIEPTGVDE